jgi:CRP-like cAMP-binding protein
MTLLDPRQFARLVPLNSLSDDRLGQLLAKSIIEELPPGRELFKEGATDGETLYVLEGEVELRKESTGASRSVLGGSDEAQYALSNLKPRQFSGRTRSAAWILRVDSALLDTLLAWDEMSTCGIEVSEIEGDASDEAWMRRLLESPALLRLPSANILQLFARFEEVPMKSGQIIIRQGDLGDYYYVIKQGRCRVVKKRDSDQKMVVLADFGEGDAFGEDALLSSDLRNATVAALCDGALMRLAKQDFQQLLSEPAVARVSRQQAVEHVRAGAGLVDVRTEYEFRRANLKGSVNVPLGRLRKPMGLDPGRRYIVYCDTGRRSHAAAFLMSERGFDVAVLQNGVEALIQSNPSAS